MFRNAYHLYRDLLPPIVMITTSIGAVSALGTASGLDNSRYNRNPKIQEQTNIFSPYINFLGKTTIGFCVGIVYPISLPICAGYIIFGEKKSE